MTFMANTIRAELLNPKTDPELWDLVKTSISYRFLFDNYFTIENYHRRAFSHGNADDLKNEIWKREKIF